MDDTDPETTAAQAGWGDDAWGTGEDAGSGEDRWGIGAELSDEEWAAANFDAEPDELDGLRTVADMMSVLAAERFQRLAALRRDALVSPVPFYGAIADVAERSLRMELAAELRMTETNVRQMLHVADRLVSRYPRMLDMLAAARTTERHAELLVELVDPVEDDLLDAVMPTALEWATTESVGPFRRKLRALVQEVRAATLEKRNREALVRRRVSIEDDGDGMAWLHALMPAVEARAIFERTTAIAKKLKGRADEDRTLDQLRSDVVCDLLIDGRTDTHPEEARGIRATVTVTVPVLTLLDNDNDNDAAGSGPAIVEGVGPIRLERARELCGTATGWTRVLTHPETGVVLSVGRDQYAPPASLKRFVQFRASRCTGPGCGMPASRCQLDHTVAWADGGRTEAINLNPLCENQHIVKHHGGWRVHQTDAHGTMEWTSPTGRRYVVRPERAGPVFRPVSSASLKPPDPPPF